MKMQEKWEIVRSASIFQRKSMMKDRTLTGRPKSLPFAHISIGSHSAASFSREDTINVLSAVEARTETAG